MRISIIGKALPAPCSDLQIFSLGLEQDALMATTGRVSHEADTSVRTREPPTEIMYAMYINLRCETEL